MEKPTTSSFAEVLKNYGDRVSPNAISGEPHVALDEIDHSVFLEKCNAAIQEAIPLYEKTREDAPGGTHERDCCTRKYKPLLVRKIDDKIPITIVIMKCYLHDKASNQDLEEWHVGLVAEDMESIGTPEEQYDDFMRIRRGEKHYIGTLLLTDEGDTFHLKELYVNPPFEGQQFENHLLHCAREFMENIPRGKTEYDFTANPAHLNTLWLLNEGGYKPDSPQGCETLQEILGGDPHYAVGEGMYVFPSDVSAEDRVIRNRDKASRINFKTPIKSNVGSIGHTVHRVHASVCSVCGSDHVCKT